MFELLTRKVELHNTIVNQSTPSEKEFFNSWLQGILWEIETIISILLSDGCIVPINYNNSQLRIHS